MAGEHVEVKGLRALSRDLKRVDDDMAKKLREIAKDAAETVASTARTLVPYRSGDLQASIRAGATARSGVVRVGKRAVPYAGPIHFGWLRRHIAPQPFLYQALDRRRTEVVEAFERQVEELIASIHTGTGE